MKVRALIVILWAIVASVHIAGAAAQVPTAEITITEPRNGATGGRQIVIRGTANVPDSQFIWLLSRRIGFEPLWWPQQRIMPDARTGRFEAVATLGDAGDVNWEFDIGVITVDKASHEILFDYWTKAMETGNWRPIRIPETTSPPRIIKVRKTSDRS